MTRPAIIVIAKQPVAGHVKTRLTPPLRPIDAALLATAALHDTLDAAAGAGAARVVVALAGERGDWLSGRRVDVVGQRGSGLDERIAAAFADVAGPALLIGMDTPQLDASTLSDALDVLEQHDAVLGPAEDGGFWAVGVAQDPDRSLFVGVPMSTVHTGAAQLARLRARFAAVALLPTVRDVDRIDDARAVACLAPSTRFARRLRVLDPCTPILR
jgi:hypothetical protein